MIKCLWIVALRSNSFFSWTQTFQSKAQEIAKALAATAATAVNPDAIQKATNNEEPTQLSVQVPGATSPDSSTPVSLSNEALLEQIQLMEADLQRAKMLLSPSLPSTPATTRSTAQVTASSPAQMHASGAHSMPPLYSSAFSPGKPPHPELPGSAVRRSSITSESGDRRRYSISSCDASLRSSQVSPRSPRSPRTSSTGTSRRPSLSTGSVAADWTNTMKLVEPIPEKRNGTPGRIHSSSPVDGGHHIHHPHAHANTHSSTRSVGSLGHSFAHSHAHTLSSTFNSTAAAYTPSKLVSLSLKKGKSVGSTGKLDRSSPLAKHVDLSIFKSPISHRRPDAKNVFDGVKQTWVPSASKKLGASAKPDRFSTTFDLMVAREVNPVFFDN